MVELIIEGFVLFSFPLGIMQSAQEERMFILCLQVIALVKVVVSSAYLAIIISFEGFIFEVM